MKSAELATQADWGRENNVLRPHALEIVIRKTRSKVTGCGKGGFEARPASIAIYNAQAAVRTGSIAEAVSVGAGAGALVAKRAGEGAISAQRSLTRMVSRKRSRNCSSL